MSVPFFSLPARPIARSLARRQNLERSSAAEVYVYSRGVADRQAHRLSMRNIDAATVTDLRAFFLTTTLGRRKLFTWTDPGNVVRSVRLAGELSVVPTGPDRFTVELELIEEVAL